MARCQVTALPANAGRRQVEADFNVWEGVFADFGAAPVEGPGFEGDAWVDKLETMLTVAAGESAPHRYPVYLLPVVAALADDGSGIRILDYGGGLGATFLGLAGAIAGADKLDYHVVDSSAVCRRGRQLYREEPRVHFCESLPEALTDVDIVHLGSVLQYIDDWSVLLGKLAQVGPRFILLSDVFAGSFRSFVTCQNVYDSKVPFRFVNEEELVETVENMGYRLLLRVPHLTSVLGRPGPLPMHNFSPELRLDHSSHFLFEALSCDRRT